MKAFIPSCLVLFAAVASAAPASDQPGHIHTKEEDDTSCSLEVVWETNWRHSSLYARYRVNARINAGGNTELEEAGLESWCEQARKHIEVGWLIGQNMQCWVDEEKNLANTDVNSQHGKKGHTIYMGLMLKAAQEWEDKWGCRAHVYV